MEQQAHRFGAAFLFPAAAFRDEVYSLNLETLFKLKPRWKVSAQLMIRRAHDLELVSKTQYERAFWKLSRAGYRTSEKYDDKWRSEQPSLLAEARLD